MRGSWWTGVVEEIDRRCVREGPELGTRWAAGGQELGKRWTAGRTGAVEEGARNTTLAPVIQQEIIGEYQARNLNMGPNTKPFTARQERVEPPRTS